jgi:hypothetical protein
VKGTRKLSHGFDQQNQLSAGFDDDPM